MTFLLDTPPDRRTGIPSTRQGSPDAGPVDDERLATLFFERGVRVTHPHGRTILPEGEIPEALYMIVSGIVRESMLLPDGRRHIVDFVGRGEIFGFSVDGEDQALIEAETDVVCLRVARATLRRIVSEDCSLAELMIRLSERRLARSHRKMVAMGCLCSVERVAHFLAWLADMNTSWGIESETAGPATEAIAAILPADCCPPPRRGSHLIPMTRREIADYLGLTLETVCRAITRLKELGLVEMPTPTTFRIPERAALDKFVLAERR